MLAAVLRQAGDETLDVTDEVEVVATEPGFVRVAIRATGVCHTDISAMNGTIPQQRRASLATRPLAHHQGAGRGSVRI
jgi:D-arabinose 1-dehydrogenase-like Zn-dependent alcohol dehydrogenase